MYRFGQWDLIVALLVIFIVFGHRLPAVMRSLGSEAIRLHHNPNTLRPTSLADWLVILVLLSLLLALFWPAMVRS